MQTIYFSKNTAVICALFSLLLFTGNAQNDTLRIMEYNMLQLSGSSASQDRVDLYLKDIVQFSKPDILLANEITNAVAVNYILSNALNTNGISYYDKGSFNSASSLNNAMFYNTEKLVFVSQDVIYTSPRPVDGYRFYYKDPALALHNDTIFLNVYVSHLKAGSTSSDMNQRATAASDIRAYLDAKPTTENHFLTGDFNLYNSSETAYQNLISAGNCQLNDPISTPGIWHNTSTYADIHTQSTRTTSFGGGATGGMDDRFDFILCTGDVLQGTHKVEYIPGSYKALGNDGNRFNKALLSSPANTLYPDTLVEALYYMSDHLPVIADFEIQLPLIDNSALTPCSDLYFSEYVEGSAYNRALELYNPTSLDIDLSDYQLHFYPDGASIAPSYRRIDLSGTVPAGESFVIAAAGAGSTIQSLANATLSQLDSLMTGNDAVLLYHSGTGDTLDIFGNIGEDPGTAGWPVDNGSTANYTLVRKDYVNKGDLNWNSSLKTWTSFPQDYLDSLGIHHPYPCMEPNSCEEIFISEYFEGSGFNRAVELYNPSAFPVVMDGEYLVRVYLNGSTSYYETILDGVIYPGEAFVLSSFMASLSNITDHSDQQDASSDVSLSVITGDDAIVLFKGEDTLDVIGVVGVDPGSSWPVYGTNMVNGSTMDHTLVRDFSVLHGQKNWSVSAASEWMVFPVDEDTYIGSHTAIACSGKEKMSDAEQHIAYDTDHEKLHLFPNPASDRVNVEVHNLNGLNNGNTRISLYDPSGNLVYERKQISPEETISIRVSGFAEGMYILVVQNDKSVYNSKLIISR